MPKVVEASDCTYFEYKSVKNIPPENFDNQFVKDLQNKDVKKLSLLKWKKYPLIKLIIDISGIILRDFFQVSQISFELNLNNF